MNWKHNEYYNYWESDDEKYMIVQISPNPASTTQFEPHFVLRYWANMPIYNEIYCGDYTLEYIKEHAEQLVLEDML